jgi:MYXO-CTERM domain-containing protein
VSRNLRTLAWAIPSAAWLLVMLMLQAPATAAAQACEEDAGGEDAGGDDEDGGFACEPPDSGTPPIAEPDASLPDGGGSIVDAGPDIGAACSCETVQGTGGGTIHVCTGARERDVCEDFECESSTVRDRPCPTRDVELCCEMSARGLYSQLYEDCDHPNCEAGFRAQCADFGGLISEGPCVIEEPSARGDDDDGGGCSVQPGRAAPDASTSALWLLGLALALWARRVGRARG